MLSAPFKQSTPLIQRRSRRAETTDVVAVIRGVIEAEDAAIVHYNKLIDLCGEAHDYVTQDLCITQLADEEGHRVMFAGFLKEYARG